MAASTIMRLARRLHALLFVVALISVPAAARTHQRLDLHSVTSTLPSFSQGLDIPPKKVAVSGLVMGVIDRAATAVLVPSAPWARPSDAPAVASTSNPPPNPLRAPPLA